MQGKFSLQITKLEICKGPKQKSCCDVRAEIENGVNLAYDIVIKQDVVPTRGKVEATINGSPFVRLQMKKPCDHLFMKPLFQSMLNVTQNCVFVKGHYFIHIDIEKVAEKYYGGEFVYGNLTFKSVFYNEQCNFSCTVIQVEMSPKKNQSIVNND
ncbi:uncharacterized protein LOC126965480 [Leptidea sinapis]|uniref:uncharacterized protein LOC126965480 n=1 Tax=Leptidea sinapis TaxID=189913 RepID=UPI0021C3E82B|nr:uncharacterized protein LOC126965480 [Leptidea sinapis]